ncbi:Putative SOS response-associated peptidase YedK [Cryptosporangium aurantiacum]|uniref:Abasic site processing protein n=2 Tax=Cryptosporangium aurantiacum TaxID=134849 RepID=A0A1M7QMU0_9ACTN|nr:Putative SOS response-associated peptidase YedK [Cryptosporangium aurantiacum]
MGLDNVADMCGRYASTRSSDDLVAEFDAIGTAFDEPLRPDYNVAPTTDVPVVRVSASRGGRVVDSLRWGLVPSWSADVSAGARMINARAESVASKPAFRSAFARRRCLVPADGWYEWSRRPDGPGKQAWYLTRADGGPCVFAGLWEVWGSGDEKVATCSIVTTEALAPLSEVHHRMPLLLPRERWAEWLGESPVDSAALLVPPTPDWLAGMELRPVGPAVGNVRNNGPELRAAVGQPAPVPLDTLF